MDTSVNAIQTQTTSAQTQITETDTAAEETAAKTIKAPTLTSTLEELAKTLSALQDVDTKVPQHGRCGHGDKTISNGKYRMFEMVERLVSSLARLVGAFADLNRTSPVTTPQTPSPETPTPPPTEVGDGNSDTSPDPAPTPTPTPSDPPTTDPEPTPPTNTTTTAISVGSLLSKTGQFLWKPISDKNGKLAVLLPRHLTGKVKEVSILSPDRKPVLQRGRSSGVGNGNREHFRFSKPGSGFPDGAIVHIKLADGTSRYVTIKDTAARTTR